MPKSITDLLVIGVGGHAVAIDPETGTELWRTKLKGLGLGVVAFSSSPGTVVTAALQAKRAAVAAAAS